MPGVCPNAIKNKFHATRRKFERKGDHFDDDGRRMRLSLNAINGINTIDFPTASESTPCRTHTYVLYVPYESALAPSLVHRSPFPTVFELAAARDRRSSIPRNDARHHRTCRRLAHRVIMRFAAATTIARLLGAAGA